MESMDLYREIEHILPLSETVQVLSALRQDPLVWNTLQKAEFLQSALQGAGNQPSCWNPGQLALVALTDTRPEILRAEPLVPLGHVLQEKALRVYQAVQRTATPPASLAEAGLLALALRERRRLTGTWSGLLQEILPRSGQADGLFQVWRTALACLYSLVPDPEEMLRALMPKALNPVAFEWVVITQLAQPFSQADHCHIFTQVLKGFPVPYQLSVLRSLSLHGQEFLAGQVADRLLIGHPAFSNLRVLAQVNGLDLSSLANRALSLQQMGTYYQLAGDLSQAASLFNAVEVVLQQWLSGLYLQNLNLRTDQAKGETGLLMDSSQLSHLASSVGWLKEDLGVVIVNHPYASSILDQVSEDQQSAFVAIKRAALMFESEPALARDLARQSSLTLLEQIRQHGMPFEGEFVYSWSPLGTLQSLVLLGLMDEALALAQAMIEIRPVDVDLIDFAAMILEQLGRIAQALDYEYAAVALVPNHPGFRRTLARLWGKLSNWPRAYEEWKQVIALSVQPEILDRQAAAQAALEAGQFSAAMDDSNQILQDDPNNGIALSVMGQALIGQGNPEQAVGYLVRATLLSPDLLPAWLALADVQQGLGEPQRALETLRGAVTALPDATEAHLALGLANDGLGLLADGLPHFKKAYLLSPEDVNATLFYGQALRRLGHITEARNVLESVRSKWPANPELAYEYAQVLLDENESESALPVLEEALRNGLPVLDGHLLYAKVLLGEYQSGCEGDGSLGTSEMQGTHSRLSQAEQVLQRILQADPENLEARFLRADILREKGNLEQALAAYRQLADVIGSDGHELNWRVQWGMARAALCLNRTDTALAAFREACQERPDNIVLRRGLAETSLLANLPQEALEVSNQVLQMASDDVDNLAWYAGFTARLGENEKAVYALERAVQIDPHRPDLMVDLAQWQMSAGDLEAARNTLDTVATMQYQWDDRYSESPHRNFMRQAAQMYLRMQDQTSALACYEKAMANLSQPDGDLYFEVAQLHDRMGNYEAALDLAQKAQNINTDSLPVIILQSDLLSRLNRPQAAIALLERSLRIVQKQDENPQILSGVQQSQLGEIHQRFTRLMLQEEDNSAALYHAEQALNCEPGNARLAYQAVDLALAMLQSDRASRVLASTLPAEGSLVKAMNEQGSDGINLLCLHIETALDNCQDQAAQEWIDEALALTPYVPRLIAAKARLLARQGEFPESRKFYGEAIRLLKKEPLADLNPHLFWLAETAVEIRAWKDALSFAENYAKIKPNEARSSLCLAKTQVKAVEFQRLCMAVGCATGAPGQVVLEESFEKKFIEAIQTAARLVNMGEIGRWQARGQAAFNPSSQTVRVLAAMPSGPEDVAALISALRLLNNRSAAIQVSRRYPENGNVLLQLALCYLEEDSLEGLAVAEQAVLAIPRDALAQAALAKLARQSSAYGRAIEAYTKALEISPDEPDWHDAVGDLYMQIGKVQQALWHRSQALELVPDQPAYAFKLGQACLAHGDTDSAIEYLERSTVLDGQNADSWLALASAYHMAGRLSQALEAAKLAGTFNPSSAEGLLIAGETALAMNQIDQALDLVRDAVRREPENSTAYLFLCNVLALQGKDGEALAVIESAPAQVKLVYPVAIERARLIYKVHGPQAALEVLEKMIKEYPEEPGLLSLIARTEAECGDTKSAEKFAFKALKLDPNQPELTLMLGKIQRKSGQLDQAVHLLSEVIRMSPNMLETYLELASVYQERREFLQALQIFRQAMRVAPNDFQSYYQSGLILRDSKDYSSAEAMLRKAAELAPDNLSIRRQLVGVIALNLVHSKQEVTIP